MGGITSQTDRPQEIKAIFKSTNEKLFHEFQHQCAQENMNQDEIYEFLSRIYDKFVQEEEENKAASAAAAALEATTAGIQIEGAATPVAASKIDTDVDYITPVSVPKPKVKPTESVNNRRASSWGIDFQKARALEEKQKKLANIQYSIVLPSQKRNNPRSNYEDVDKGAFDFVVDTDEFDSLERQLAAQKAAQQHHPFVCVLCKKAFDTQSLLYTHFQHSQLHSRTVEEKHALLEDAVDEARKMSVLLDLASNALKSTRGASVDLSTMQWSSITSKVVAKFISKKHEALLADLKAYNTINPPKDDVSVIFSGSKFFWRQRLTFGINIFHHRRHNCIEVVPKLFPTISKVDNEVEAGLRRSFPTNSAVGSPIECTRLYVDFSLLKISHASWKGFTSRKVTPPSPALTIETQHNEDDECDDEKTNPTTASSVVRSLESSLDVEGEGGGKAVSVEASATGEHLSATVSSPTEEDLAKQANTESLIEYLLDQLKIDPMALDKFNSGLRTMPCGVSLLAFADSSAVLQQPPTGLVPSTIDDKTAEKTYHDWEIKRKIHQVSTSCLALTHAVHRTEQLVKEKSTRLIQEKEEEEAQMTPLRRMLNYISPRKKPQSSSHFHF